MSFGIPVRNGLGAGLLASTFLSSLRIGGRPAMSLNFVGTTTLDSRITFTRGSNATLVDATGKITYAPANLLTYSADFANATWAKQAGATATTNSITFTADPLSRLTVDIGPFTGLSKVIASVRFSTADVGKTISLGIWTTTLNGSSTGRSPNLTIPADGVVTYTWSSGVAGLSIFAIFNDTVGVAKTVTLASGGGAQLEPVTYQTTPSTYNATTASAYYGPRFDYDPVTLGAKGLLIEEARTNNALYSEQFDNAAWTKVATTVSANAAISPDGATTGDKLIEDAATSIHRAAQSFTTTTNVAVSYTVYAKADTRRYLSLGMGGLNGVVATFDLQTGVISGAATALGTGWSTATAVITPTGNGWYRCALSGVDTAGASRPLSISINNVSTNPTNAQGNSYAGDNASGLFIWGAQIETGAFATSYIPTVAAAVSRSADVAQMTNTNFSSWYNQIAGTFVVSADCPALGSRTAFSADDATTANLIRVRSAVAEPIFVVNAGGANQATLDGGSITANTIYTQAAAYAADNFATSVNGGAAVTDTSGSVPTVSRLSIGADPSGNYLNGHIRTINYYNTRLPNNTLQALTT